MQLLSLGYIGLFPFILPLHINISQLMLYFRHTYFSSTGGYGRMHSADDNM